MTTMTLDEYEEKIALMLSAYPSLRVVSTPGQAPLAWEGDLQPLLDRDRLDELLQDLDNDRTVKIDRERGVVVHDPDCLREHGQHPVSTRVLVPVSRFKIRIEDYCDGRLPRAQVLEPFIPKEERRHHLSEDGICAFSPSEHPWNPSTSSIVTDFTDHVLIWLLKQHIFSTTKDVWLGSEAPHEAPYLLSTIGPYQQCFCGSGKFFSSCHRIHVGYQLFGRPWFIFEAWWSAHNADSIRFCKVIPRRTPQQKPNLAKGKRVGSTGF
mgnify:CR=1 FL=1